MESREEGRLGFVQWVPGQKIGAHPLREVSKRRHLKPHLLPVEESEIETAEFVIVRTMTDELGWQSYNKGRHRLRTDSNRQAEYSLIHFWVHQENGTSTLQVPPQLDLPLFKGCILSVSVSLIHTKKLPKLKLIGIEFHVHYVVNWFEFCL